MKYTIMTLSKEMKRMKKLILNKKGMMLYNILLVITVALAFYPSLDKTTMLVTKGFAIVLISICALLNKYTK